MHPSISIAASCGFFVLETIVSAQDWRRLQAALNDKMLPLLALVSDTALATIAKRNR
jgi:hypothetical protein